MLQLDQPTMTIKNVMLFDTLCEDDLLYTKSVISKAVEQFAEHIRSEKYGAAGEAHSETTHRFRKTSTYIDLDLVSHIVERVRLTPIGLDVELRLLSTPKGELVKHWMENADWRLYVRRSIHSKSSLIAVEDFSIIAIDIVRGNDIS